MVIICHRASVGDYIYERTQKIKDFIPSSSDNITEWVSVLSDVSKNHDVEGLIDLIGKDKFASKLDSLFLISSKQNEGASIDVSGLIGQYTHGNEPGHHTTYLYNYVGQSWKTAENVRKIMNEMYIDKPDGLCGNEDCGQMSAWYILSSMGFYSVNPGNSAFVIGSPLHEEAIIHGEKGKDFKIKTINNSSKNIYIQSVK